MTGPSGETRARTAVPHAVTPAEAYALFGTGPRGLSREEAAERLRRYGPNALPHGRAPSVLVVFLHQFLSPLIYILLAAAVVSAALQHWADAGFILAVLALNAVIGTIQEYGAERSAQALRSLIVSHARVIRGGDEYEVDGEQLVPGDLVLLDSGGRVPADARLVAGGRLEVDESLLTGESLPVAKSHELTVGAEAALGDRTNMAFAGTLVARGHARAVVTATGLHTQLGLIAASVGAADSAKPPLIVRMEQFTGRIAIVIGVAVVVVGAASLARGMPWGEVFLLAVALAVSAIPEGLPVALTVALAVAVRRMGARRVIARRLVAVEALGSCTYIASDKTGTLTLNELTARRVALPGEPAFTVTGEGARPDGEILVPDDARARLEELALAVALCNDAFFGHRDGTWASHGDAVDIALLVLAHKAGVVRAEVEAAHPRLADIPFEPEWQYAASLNRFEDGARLFVKGAGERLLPMCTRMVTAAGEVPIDHALLEGQALLLARQGDRVLAVASAAGREETDELGPDGLHDLVFLGFVGLLDPLRPEVKSSVAACRRAGIEVAMVTGDHPETALAIARELGMAAGAAEVVTGPALRRAQGLGEEALERVVRGAHVFARVEPEQKLQIVKALIRLGHFVAVTGDGANDAPALKAANIGVAMGERGTDVARETAELILTDDNFASIVAGVEEGRIAYANVRKVVFFLLANGAGEIVLFLLALAAGLPLPLLAVQLLWLNLVTSGIQDVALAFEPGEGGELDRPPRSPREPLFNRLMIERTAIAAIVMGATAFVAFRWLLDAGWTVERARNALLLLIVLFENVQAASSRSERTSVFRLNPLRNPLLLIGTIVAHLVHLGAAWVPGVREVLGVQPVSLGQWGLTLAAALLMLVAMELHKAWHRARDGRRVRPALGTQG